MAQVKTIQVGGTNYEIDGVPSLTLDSSQIISTSPVKIQLTDAQYNTFANYSFVNCNTAALGMGNTGMTKYSEDSSYLIYGAVSSAEVYSVNNEENGISSLFTLTDASFKIVKSTKIGTLTARTINTQEINRLLNQKAPYASPEFTGTPTAPTAATGTSTTQIATTAFVQAAISGSVTDAIAASY